MVLLMLLMIQAKKKQKKYIITGIKCVNWKAIKIFVIIIIEDMKKMIDMQQIGYYLYMEEQEKQKQQEENNAYSGDDLEREQSATKDK